MSRDSTASILYDSSGNLVVTASGAAVSTSGVPIMGSDGTNARFFSVDSSGRVILTGPAAAGAAIAGNPILVGGSDGTLARFLLVDTGGRPLVKVTDGTNFMPTMDVAARAAFQKITDGTSVAAVKAANTAAVFADPALVVALSPNSLPQTPADNNATATAGALNATVIATTGGCSTVAFHFQGTWSATFIFEAQTGNGVWVQVPCYNVSVNTFAQTITSNQLVIIQCGGYPQVRARISAYVSGTASITWNAGSGTNLMGERITDGTNGPVAVKAASIAPVATDPALVVVISPNQQAIAVTTSPATSTPGLSAGDVALSSATTSAIRRTAYTEQAANFVGSIISSNAADAAAGTGARTVQIYWVSLDGLSSGVETATLNGTTSVPLVTATKCFIERMEVATAGSGGVPAGTITLRNAAVATVGTIAAGDNSTFWAHHYVVSGKTCNITSAFHGNNSTVSGGTSLAIIRSRPFGANTVEEQVSDFIGVGGAMNPFSRNYGSVIQITGPARVVMYVTSTSATSITYRGSFDYYDV